MRDRGGLGVEGVEEWKLVGEAGVGISNAPPKLGRVMHDASGTKTIIIANIRDSGNKSSTSNDEWSEAKIFSEATFGVSEVIRLKEFGAIAVEPSILSVMAAGEKRKGGKTRHGGETGF